MAKQAQLIEDRGIEEIDRAAEALKETRTQRMALLQEEIKLADDLLNLMRKHKRATYSFDRYEVEVVPGKDKVRVRTPKEEVEEEDE